MMKVGKESETSGTARVSSMMQQSITANIRTSYMVSCHGFKITIGVRIDNNRIEIAIQTRLSVCLTANDEKIYNESQSNQITTINEDINTKQFGSSIEKVTFIGQACWRMA